MSRSGIQFPKIGKNEPYKKYQYTEAQLEQKYIWRQNYLSLTKP